MRTTLILLFLANFALAQDSDNFVRSSTTLVDSAKKVGTGNLPDGFVEAAEMAAIKALRVRAAEDQVSALRARYMSGLDNINFLLQAQIELALARIDTTNDKAKQLEHIQAGLNAAIITWQTIKEIQKVGAIGGDAAAEAQARNQVFRFYVWWHKLKAGQNVGTTLIQP